MPERYRLADPTRKVPMPDRGGRLFSQSENGEVIDLESPFYRALIADGDIVPVVSKPQANVRRTTQPAAGQRGKSKGE